MHQTIIRIACQQDLPALSILFDDYRQFYAQASNIETAHTFLAERIKK